MTFDDYLNAVISYYLVGGVTWGQAYQRVLAEERPDIADHFKGTRVSAEEDLGGFLYLVYTKWKYRG